MKVRLRVSFFVGITFVWSLMGFPFLASSANALGIASSEFIVGIRAMVAVLCGLLFAFSLTKYRQRSSLHLRLLLLFFVLYSLRIAYDTIFNSPSLNQTSSYYWSFAVGVTFLPAITLSFLANHLNFPKIFLPLLVMGIVVLTLAITFGDTLVHSVTSGTYDTGRLALVSINPISLGHVGATILILTYWRLRMMGFDLSSTILWLAGTILGLYAVFAAGSRGPLVALICAILFLEAVKGGRALVFLSIASTPMLAVLTIDISQLEATLGTNIFSRFETAINGGDASSLARLDQMGSAWQLFLDHPLLGAGLEDPAYGIYPHNVVIEAFMALGLFGGILFVALLAMACARAFRLARSNPAWSAYGALFVQYLVGAQLSGGLYNSSVMWALLGCIAGTKIPWSTSKVHQRQRASSFVPRINTFPRQTVLTRTNGTRTNLPKKQQPNFTGTKPKP